MGQVCPCFAFASSSAAGRPARAPPLLPAADDKAATKTRGVAVSSKDVCWRPVPSIDEIDDVPFTHIAVDIGPPPSEAKDEPPFQPLEQVDEGLRVPQAGFDLKLDPVYEEARVPQVASASSVSASRLPASPNVITEDPKRSVRELPSFSFVPVSVEASSAQPIVAQPSLAKVDSQNDSDDDDFDLARLCSAMRRLEQSATRASLSGSGNKFQVRTAASDAAPAAAVPLQKPTAIAHTLPSQITTAGSSPQVGSPQLASRTLLINSGSSQTLTPHSATPTNAMSMSRDRRLSSGKGSPTGSEDAFGGWSLKAPHASSEATAARVQDAQKMNAWMERVLAKGGGPLGVSASLSSPDSGGLVPLDVPPPACWSDAAASASLAAAAAANSSVAPRTVPIVPVVPIMPTVPVVSVAPSSPTVAKVSTLEVSLGGDVLGTLKFTAVDGVEGPCTAFVSEHRLREIFLAPLIAHAELMVHMGKGSDAVDVVDLL